MNRFNKGDMVYYRKDLTFELRKVQNISSETTTVWDRSIVSYVYKIEGFQSGRKITEPFLSSTEGFDDLYPYTVEAYIDKVLDVNGKKVIQFQVLDEPWYEEWPVHCKKDPAVSDKVMVEIMSHETARILSHNGTEINLLNPAVSWDKTLKDGDVVEWHPYAQDFLEQVIKYPGLLVIVDIQDVDYEGDCPLIVVYQKGGDETYTHKVYAGRVRKIDRLGEDPSPVLLTSESQPILKINGEEHTDYELIPADDNADDDNTVTFREEVKQVDPESLKLKLIQGVMYKNDDCYVEDTNGKITKVLKY